MLIFMTHISGKNRTSHTSRNEHCVTTKQALVAPSLHCRPFQRNLEWWAKFVLRAWMTVVSCRKHDIQWPYSLPGGAGCVGAAISSPVGPGGKARKLQRPCSTQYQKCPQKATFLVNFYLCAAYKLKDKIHLNWKKLCARQIIQPHARWTSWSASHSNTKAQTAWWIN